MSKTLFNVSFMKNIEEILNEYIIERNYILNNSLSLKELILQVITSIKSNPKSEHIISDKHRMESRVINVIKRYLDENMNSKIKDDKLLENRKTQHYDIKHLILDSLNAKIKDNKFISFSFLNEFEAKGIKIDSFVIKSINRIYDLYAYLDVKELRTTKYYNEDGLQTCTAVFQVHSEVQNFDQSYTYVYKNINLECLNDISKSINELTFEVKFKQSIDLTTSIKIKSKEVISDNIVVTLDSYIPDKLIYNKVHTSDDATISDGILTEFVGYQRDKIIFQRDVADDILDYMHFPITNMMIYIKHE